MKRNIEEKNKMISSENTYNCMTAQDRILNDKTYMISASALLLVFRHFYHVGRHVHMISALARIHDQCFGTPASVRHFYHVGRHVSVPYRTVPSSLYCTESHSFFISGPSKIMFIHVYLNKKR